MKEQLFVDMGILEQEIYSFLASKLENANFEDIEIKHLPTIIRTTIYTTQPGVVIGPGGKNIESLTNELKERFKQDIQLDIKRIENNVVAPRIVAKNIARGIENKKNHTRLAEYHLNKLMRNENVLGVEIIFDGLISGSKTRKDKFSKGYMKKSGELAEKYVKKSKAVAQLKTGIIGIKISVYLKPN